MTIDWILVDKPLGYMYEGRLHFALPLPFFEGAILYLHLRDRLHHVIPFRLLAF